MLIYEVLKIRNFSKLLRLPFATHFGVATHRLGTTGLKNKYADKRFLNRCCVGQEREC